jgi:hypothetical protein
VPEDYPYNTLKAHLLETYTLSNKEKMDFLFKSKLLGGQKPPCRPTVPQAWSSPSCSYTGTCSCNGCQSPCGLCLGEQEPGDIRSLAAGVDKLQATYKQQSHDIAANVDIAEEQSTAQITAVQKKEPRQKKKLSWRKFRGQPPTNFEARRHWF